ncbi:hypothetical protein [Neobacillus cucumis]|uniref:Uncharacterized protein n=1 Tax=Neobacillus cucumis TaxID=1740721 RepID=A0A2N5HFF8_9BACI|nr:hypothetical protein [Neobacillus cucumis]PLS04266.1 hypothetical protein CVD27_12250 [Neobacillus cucumis]
MEKKKFTSWGVSFASLALFAGMMSYMGFTKKDPTSNTTTVAQSQVTPQSSTQQSESNSNQDSSVTYEVPSQSTDTNQSQQSSDQSVSEDSSFPSQHGGFDTTTGGT